MKSVQFTDSDIYILNHFCRKKSFYFEHTKRKINEEDYVYQYADFFPLKTVQFQVFPVSIPNQSHKVLTGYFNSDNWMEFCVPPALNHREYEKTQAPFSYFPVTEVIEYLNDIDKLKN